MADANDLITPAVVRSVTDKLAAFYSRIQDVFGTTSAPLSGTLAAGISATDSSVTLDAPSSGDWEDYLSPGVYTVGSEKMLIGTWSGNTGTILTRGIEGTLATTHALGSTLYFPSTISRLAAWIQEDLVGDGSSVYGLGRSRYAVIKDLGETAYNQLNTCLWSEVLHDVTSDVVNALNNHIAIRAPAILTGTPSWATDGVNFSAGDLNDYLRYYNDPDAETGVTSAFSTLVHEYFAYLYWLEKGTPLNNKVVFPGITTLASIDGTSGDLTVSTHLNRYGEDDSETWTQGYAAQRIRARVTTAAAGAGTLTLTLKCQGMGEDNAYFGRPATCTITVGAGATTGDSVTINGVTFTVVAASPGACEFLIGASTTTAATNLAEAINNAAAAAATSDALGNITATASDADVTLSQATGDTTNYLVTSSDAAKFALAAGTATSQSRVSFGGGDDDGQGEDDDPDLHEFTGDISTATVGTVQNLTNGTAGQENDRVLRIVDWSVTKTGDTDGAVVIIETVPDRTVI